MVREGDGVSVPCCVKCKRRLREREKECVCTRGRERKREGVSVLSVENEGVSLREMFARV